MINLSTAGSMLTAAVEDRPPSVDKLRRTIRRRQRRRKVAAVSIAAILTAAGIVAATTRGHTPPATQVTSRPPANTAVTPGQEVPTGDVEVTQVIDSTHLVGTSGSIVVMSADGGATWTEAGTPTLVASSDYQIGFGDPQHGWAWSSQLTNDRPNVEVTADGGRTWRLVPQLTDVINIVASPDNRTVWALTDSTSGPQATTSTFGLWISTNEGATWSHHPSGQGHAPGTPVGLQGLGFLSGLIRAGQTTGYQLTSATETSPVSLTETTDSGRTWTTRPTPCTSGALLAADNPGDLWLLCLGSFATGLQHVSLYRTTSDQQPWHLTAVSSDPLQSGQAALGSITAFGYPETLIATTPDHAYVLNEDGEFNETLDGGSQWQTAVDTGVGAEHALTMLSPTNGAAWLNDALWTTTDGIHWGQEPGQ